DPGLAAGPGGTALGLTVPSALPALPAPGLVPLRAADIRAGAPPGGERGPPRRLPPRGARRMNAVPAELEIQGLTKYFRVGGALFDRARVHAVDDVSFVLRPGTITALVGESGSGKSTVARLLARLYTPTGGRVLFDGED